MKYFLSLLIGFTFSVSCSTSTPQYHNILQTEDIQEIELFLKTIHPDDPRKPILKQKLITLKNKEWTKGKQNHTPIPQRIVEKQLPTHNTTNIENPPNEHDEEQEFKTLMQQYNLDKKNNAIKALNQIFDNDPHSKEIYITIQNKSECNMILKISGNQEYKIPIPAKDQNHIVVEKGQYTLQGKLCSILYHSSKNLQKSSILTLNTTTSQPAPSIALPQPHKKQNSKSKKSFR